MKLPGLTRRQTRRYLILWPVTALVTAVVIFVDALVWAWLPEAWYVSMALILGAGGWWVLRGDAEAGG